MKLLNEINNSNNTNDNPHANSSDIINVNSNVNVNTINVNGINAYRRFFSSTSNTKSGIFQSKFTCVLTYILILVVLRLCCPK